MNALNYASLCVKCGKCLSTCPTYSALLFETLSPRGRLCLIDAITTQRLNYKNALESLATCMLCGRCEGVCELKIPITKVIAEMRYKMSVSSALDFVESVIRILFGMPQSQKRKLKLLARIANILPKNYTGGLPYRIIRLDSRIANILKELRVKTFLELFGREQKSETALFVGCAVNYLFHEVGKATVSLFEKMEIPLDIPKYQGCCGLLLWAVGDKNGAKQLAEKNLKVFRNYKKIIFICRSCSYAFRTLYSEFFSEDEKNLCDHIFDATEILAANDDRFYFTSSGKEAELHVACHAKLKNSELNFFKRAEVSIADLGCCGGGGSFGIKFPDLSKRIAKNRIDKVSSPMLITDCLGCYIQLKYFQIDKKLSVNHVLEWLDEKTKAKRVI